MRQVLPRIQYQVWYQANPKYKGSFNVPDHVGLHGRETDLTRAEELVEACKRWFNTEKIVTERADEQGDLKRDVKTKIHDNVIVTIEKYVDDVLVEIDGEPVKQEEKELVPA